VERQGQLGYAKYGMLWREKLAAELARIVGVPVPPVEFGTVMGQVNTISLVHNESSVPLREKEDWDQPYSSSEAEALSRASGLLPFLIWVGAEDHGDDTNLIIDKIGDGQIRIMAVDFDESLKWSQGEEFFGPNSRPPGLVVNSNPTLVKQTLAAIEHLTDAQIQACCAASRIAPEPAQHLVDVLLRRQRLLSPHLSELGLLG
jgi:hypothetical protein